MNIGNKAAMPSFSMAGMSRLLDKTVHIALLALVFILFLDGFCNQRLGISGIETLYYVAIILLILARVLFAGIPLKITMFLLAFLALIMTESLIVGTGDFRLIDDIRYFIRSMFIGALVFWVYYTSKWIKDKDLEVLFAVYWIMVTALVLAHFLFGVGGVVSRASGQLKLIYSSYFIEGNVISFLYLVSWFYFYSKYGPVKKTLIAVMTIIISFLLSSKSLLLGVVLLVGLSLVWRYSHRSSVRKLVANFIIISLLIIPFIFIDELIEMFLIAFAQVTPDGAKLLWKMNTSDLITIVTSTRNLKAQGLLEMLQQGGALSWLFGLGANRLIDGKLLVEIDLFDLLKIYGLAGIALFAVAFAWVWARFVRKAQCDLKVNAYWKYIFGCGVFVASVVISSASGHILTTAGPMMILGAVFGYLSSPRIVEALSARKHCASSYFARWSTTISRVK